MPMGAPVTSTPVATAGHSAQLPAAATLGALGVVYGDIGTSPLYALKEAAKAATHGGPLTNEAVLGVVSLILWALILIISIKYALLILRADNRGEGGIVAILALLGARHAQPGTWRAQLLVVGRGAALRRRRHHAGDFGAQRHRRPEGRCAIAGAGGGADHHRHPGRPVRDAEAGHRIHRPDLWSGDARLVRRARGPRHPRHRQGPGGAGCAESALCLRVPDPPKFPRLLRDSRRRLPRRHRRRGDVCRHGAFRAAPDPPCVVCHLPARAGVELFRAGRPIDHG